MEKIKVLKKLELIYGKDFLSSDEKKELLA